MLVKNDPSPGTLALLLMLAACGTTQPPVREATVNPPKSPNFGFPARRRPASPLPCSRRAAVFYKDDGPADEIPDGLDDIPDAEPKGAAAQAGDPAASFWARNICPTPRLAFTRPAASPAGMARKFHGQKTSIGEPYDMFAMTAAHTTLALPSYARVTNVQTGKSVVVRVTDRGPFHADRVDLSYTAAYKLGLINGGSGRLRSKAIIPGEAGSTTYARSRHPLLRNARNTCVSPNAWRREENWCRPPPSRRQRQRPATCRVYSALGAFANADNADNLKNHLGRELDWLAEPMRVVPGNGIHRIQVGPLHQPRRRRPRCRAYPQFARFQAHRRHPLIRP